MTNTSTEAKIVIVGDSRVGKTSIWSRLSDKSFSQQYLPTIGVDFAIKHIDCNGRDVKLRIWDTTGQYRFRSIVGSYYRNTQFLIVVYSADNLQSFKSVQGWFKEATNLAQQTIVGRILIANKTDIQGPQRVSTEQGRQMARRWSAQYFEVSAKINIGIQQPFKYIANKMIEHERNNQPRSERSIVRPPRMEEEQIPKQNRLVNYAPLLVFLSCILIYFVYHYMTATPSNNKVITEQNL